MLAAKLLIGVEVGLSPVLPIPEKCRTWTYTSVDYERDKDEGFVELARISDEAAKYARSQMNPAENNCVRMEWIWL